MNEQQVHILKSKFVQIVYAAATLSELQLFQLVLEDHNLELWLLQKCHIERWMKFKCFSYAFLIRIAVTIACNTIINLQGKERAKQN